MKFGFEQRWTTTVQDVVELYISEDFWRSLDSLTKTSPPDVLEVSRKGDTAVTRLQYRLCVDLPKEAGRFIDPDDVSWVEVTTWNLPAATATVAFEPTQAAALMKAGANAVVLPSGDDVVRRVTGELKVRIPLLGGKVEKVVVEGIGQHLEEEADAVAGRLEA